MSAPCTRPPYGWRCTRDGGHEGPCPCVRADPDPSDWEGAPSWDAYLAACRSTNWRNAQLRFHGVEPITIPTNAPMNPPPDFNFATAGQPSRIYTDEERRRFLEGDWDWQWERDTVAPARPSFWQRWFGR